MANLKDQLELMLSLVKERIQANDATRQSIIDKGAHEGKTISTEAVFRRLEASKANYRGADRAAYIAASDNLAREFREKYPGTIPVDEAYRLMKK
jgi:hypothetical protein